MSQLDPAAESLLAFWRDAGVVDAFADAPQNRLTESELRRRATTPAPGALPRPAAAGAAPDLAEAAMAAREAALAAGDLQALSEAVAAFASPALQRGARRAVFARGSFTPKVVVIGEAPGAEDEREGAPFAGPAGRLLDRALTAAGLHSGALLTQTVFWRTSGDRSPSLEEQAVCAPFLDRLIASASPGSCWSWGRPQPSRS
jgi:DNA polymerase